MEYNKKMLAMLAKRYMTVLSTKGVAEAQAFQKNVLKGDEDLIKQIIPYVHAILASKGKPVT